MKTIPDDGLDIAPVPLRGHAVIAFAQKVDRDPVVRDQPKRGRPRSEPPPLPTSGALAGVLDALDREMAEIDRRSEEHTSELQSLMRISYAVFCLKKKQTR